MQWWLVAVLGVLISFILLMKEEPLQDVTTSDDVGVYNIVDLSAPAFAGSLLPYASWLLTKSFLSPFLLRKLLKDNGIRKIRDLANSDAVQSFPPAYYPVHPLSDEELVQHTEAAVNSGSLSMIQRTSWPESNLHQYLSNEKRVFRSIMDYFEVYQSRAATPSQVMERVLLGCQKLQPRLRLFTSILPDDVRQQASESDERWKNGVPRSVLDGVPIAVKDMLDVKGHVIVSGSSNSATKKASTIDDIIVRRLKMAGAIILGITVMTEGGVTPLGYNAHFDGPFNAHNTDYYSGGSSSGSAVAVSSGLVPVVIGFDGGGSIRVPAAMSGIAGLAMTFGRMPYDSRSLGFTNVKAGPIAGNTEDIALAHLTLSQIAEPNHAFTRMIHNLPPPHLGGVVDGVKGLRLGIFWDHFSDTDPEVLEACTDAVRYLEGEGGALLVNITIPNLRELGLSHGIKIAGEFATFWETAFYDPNHKLEANTEITIALGRTVSASELMAAERVRSYFMHYFTQKIFAEQKIDAIVMPTMGVRVPKTDEGFFVTMERTIIP